MGTTVAAAITPGDVCLEWLDDVVSLSEEELWSELEEWSEEEWFDVWVDDWVGVGVEEVMIAAGSVAIAVVVVAVLVVALVVVAIVVAIAVVVVPLISLTFVLVIKTTKVFRTSQIRRIERHPQLPSSLLAFRP
jgi:Flp pilus assembly protein TadB